MLLALAVVVFATTLAVALAARVAESIMPARSLQSSPARSVLTWRAMVVTTAGFQVLAVQAVASIASARSPSPTARLMPTQLAKAAVMAMAVVSIAPTHSH